MTTENITITVREDGARVAAKEIRDVGAAAKASQAQIDDFNGSLNRMGKNAQINRQHLLNLSFQLQDIFVGLASGQKPLTVFIQQGAQIQGIASQAGVSLMTLGRAALAMIAPFLPLAAAVGALYGAFKLFQDEAGKNANLEAYAKSLGYTDSQIKKLDADTVTFTDTMKGLWATLNDGNGNAGSGFFDGLEKSFKNFLGFFMLGINSMLAVWDATKATMVAVWNTFPTEFRKPIVDAANFGIEAFEKFINFSIEGINRIIGGLNKFATVKIDPIESVAFERLKAPVKQDAGNLGLLFANSYQKALKERQAGTAQFMKDWMNNSVKEARARILENDPNADKNSQRRANALAKVNAQLDNELARMFMLKDAREQQQKFDQIQEQLLGKGVKLSDEMTASIKARIAAIQQGQVVQRQFDRIYEEAIAPARDYQATLTATDKLLKINAISQEDADKAIIKAGESYKTAIDPLYQFNRGLDQQTALLGKVGMEREVATQMQQLQNQLLQKGVILNEQETAAIRNKLQALYQLKLVDQQRQQIYQDTSGAARELLAREEALNQARAQGAISQQYYNTQLAQTNVQMAELLNAMGNGDMFSAITAGLGQVTKDFVSVATSAANIIGTMFTTLTDGVSNAIAGAIVKGESLNDTLYNLSQTILTELLSSLIKLGIQYVLNAALGQAAAAGALAATTAMAASAAAAWAPAAAAASLASFGSNAGPAIAGMTAAYGAAQGLSAVAIPAFKTGGDMMVGGFGGTDSQLVAFRATPNEKVSIRRPGQDGYNSQSESSNNQRPVQVNNTFVLPNIKTEKDARESTGTINRSINGSVGQAQRWV